MEKSYNSGSSSDSFKNTPTARNAANAASSAANTASNVASDAKNAIMDKAAPAMDYLKENFSAVRDTTQPYIQDAEALIKRHPFYALAGAVAVGAVFGAIIARPSRSV
jgi:ElaB/YqjD/DUF883 family membrane-anchored ribosome-binding protein